MHPKSIKTLILGLENTLLKDDGVGIRVALELEKVLFLSDGYTVKGDVFQEFNNYLRMRNRRPLKVSPLTAFSFFQGVVVLQ